MRAASGQRDPERIRQEGRSPQPAPSVIRRRAPLRPTATASAGVGSPTPRGRFLVLGRPVTRFRGQRSDGSYGRGKTRARQAPERQVARATRRGSGKKGEAPQPAPSV